MLSIPISLLLIPYGLFFAFFLFYATFNTLQLLKFGVRSFQSWLILALFIGLSILVVIMTILRLYAIDWTSNIDLGFPLNPPSL